MSKIALNGRLLLRKPRLYRSCRAAEEEEGVGVRRWVYTYYFVGSMLRLRQLCC
jgi:hypothetical protein